jgi:hypothetical protein
MKVRFLTTLAVSILCLSSVPLASASLITVNFDNMAAQCCDGNVTNIHNGIDSRLTFGVLTINGGMVADSFKNATSAPNVYATSDPAPVAFAGAPMPFAGALPGHIDMTFSSPVSDVAFDVINGGMASTFTALAFDAHGNPLGVDNFNLSCSSCSGSVGHVWFDFGGVRSIDIRSGQLAGGVNFAVDTIKFSTVPEPGTLMLLGSAIVLGWRQRKRFFNR